MCPSTSQVTCHHVSPRSHATAGPSPSGRRAGRATGRATWSSSAPRTSRCSGRSSRWVSRRRPEPRPTSPRRPWAPGWSSARSTRTGSCAGPHVRPSPLAPDPAAPEELAGLQRSAAAGLTVGTWHTAGDRTTAELRAGGFNRHTFLCGQSGSGRPTPSESSSSGSSWAPTCGSSSWIPTPTSCASGRPRTARPGRRPRASPNGCAPLRLLAQRGHGAVADALPDDGPKGPGGGRAARPGARPRRVQRLHHPARAARGRGPRRAARQHEGGHCRRAATRPPHREPRSAAVGGVGLRPPVGRRCRHRSAGSPSWTWAGSEIRRSRSPYAWRSSTSCGRDRRVPTLLVIDEAHNLCSTDPGNPVARLLLDRLIQIAAEGGSTVSGFCSPHSDRPRSTPRSSASATTSCSCG